MDKYPNTERNGWRNITPEDATSEELHLVHRIFGERPSYITPKQWRDNMRGCAKDIRAHVAEERQKETNSRWQNVADPLCG